MIATAEPWLLWLAWISAGLALMPLLMAARNLTSFTVPAVPPPPGTRVSILIPARNEEGQLEETIRHALTSVGVEVEVIVLDDHSSDDTAYIARRMASRDPRVRLVSASTLPPGWAGKQRACQLLADASRYETLMFIDCDVRISRHAASMAAGRLLSDDRLGMISGYPKEVTASVGEQLVVPWMRVLLLGYMPMSLMRRSTSPAYAAACGQWVVARKSAYEEVGGHGAAPASRHDAVSLPRTFRQAGWKTDLFNGTTLARCRMYEDFAGVWQGFGKSAGEGMTTVSALPVWTVLIAGGHLLPWLLLPIGLSLHDHDVAWAASVGVGANLAMRMLLRHRLRQSLLGVLLHPFGAGLLLAINWMALARHVARKPGTWRGRQYVRN